MARIAALTLWLTLAAAQLRLVDGVDSLFNQALAIRRQFLAAEFSPASLCAPRRVNAIERCSHSIMIARGGGMIDACSAAPLKPRRRTYHITASCTATFLGASLKLPAITMLITR